MTIPAELAAELERLLAEFDAASWVPDIERTTDHVAEFALDNKDAILASLRSTDALAVPRQALHIIFDGPPGHESGRFVEVETPDGHSINAGEWRHRADGLWELVIPDAALGASHDE